MAGSSEPPFDPWRDVDGVHIERQCRVEQIAVSKHHGALPSRLHHQGEVVARATMRVYVLFDGEHSPISVRPHLLRVVPPKPDE
jgi:hypothetical protein